MFTLSVSVLLSPLASTSIHCAAPETVIVDIEPAVMFSLIVLVIAPPCETRAIIFTGPLIVTLFPVVVSGSIALLEAPPNSGSFTVKATVLGVLSVIFSSLLHAANVMVAAIKARIDYVILILIKI